MPKKIRIGDLLVKNGLLTDEQLTQALALQKKTGGKLGRVLVQQGFVEQQKFLHFLAEQLEIPFIDLRRYRFDTDLANRLPEAYARRFRAILLEEQPGGYLVGMADPIDLFAYDELSKALGKEVLQAVVDETLLLNTLDSIYRKTDEIVSLAEELGEELGQGGLELADLLPDTGAEDAPVARLLKTLFEDAVQVGASDIHIEPDDKLLRIRQRIDGELYEQTMKERQIAPAVVSRLKLVSGLDISERRLPQDGRFNIHVKGRSVDVRISTMPLADGESVVMRLLDQSGGILELEQIGMPPTMMEEFRKAIHNPHGMVLVTGPTGSGKTTTLYGALNELNTPSTKIITVEDPVEYRLPRINQVQINPKIGLHFSDVLRSSLRQDPDVIMVGEMRDQETAEIGLRAAMTGHMVLSTLHTNDAVSTALRLLDMGAQGFVVASALRAVLAQRLVRRICSSCREDDPLDPQQRSWLQSLIGDKATGFSWQRGSGCPHCHNTGYHGRIGVFELLQMNDDLADALRRNDGAGFSQAAKRNKDFKPLVLGALEYAAQGITTIQEVIRVSGEVEQRLPKVRVKEPADA